MATVASSVSTGSKATWQYAALFVALLWSIGLLVAAAALPAYQGSTVSVTGGSTSTTSTSTHTATLVGENGSGVLFVVGIPLAVVVLVGAMLMLRRRRRRHGAGPLAWTVVGLLGGFTFLAMLTIGIFIIPVVVMLAIACATAPEDPRAHL